MVAPVCWEGTIGVSPPPNSTCALLSKFEFDPLMVRVNEGPPARTDVGVMLEMPSEEIWKFSVFELVFAFVRLPGVLVTESCAVPGLFSSPLESVTTICAELTLLGRMTVGVPLQLLHQTSSEPVTA